jgi:hypothetical protein
LVPGSKVLNPIYKKTREAKYAYGDIRIMLAVIVAVKKSNECTYSECISVVLGI